MPHEPSNTGPPREAALFDYVTVGHVTLDVVEDAEGGPHEQIGGGAFYSALQAARLGLRTLILTQGEPRQLERLLEPYCDELDVRIAPAEHTTTLRTWASGTARRQRLAAWAGPMHAGHGDVRAGVLHLAPVARETPADVALPAKAGFVGLTPQGLVRTWDRDGWLRPCPLAAEQLPARLHAAVFNERERNSCATLLDRAQHADGGPLVAVTAAGDPIELLLPGGPTARVPAIAVPREACDDLGAGDVFAAALFAAMWQGQPPEQAARRASAAAALRICGHGAGAVADARAIDALLKSTPVSGR